MKTLKVLLKQHTPLIHFQHDQEGATLRASEVKPKLDRFIIEKLGNGKAEVGKGIAKNKKWLIGSGEHAALDYKLRITAKSLEFFLIEGYFGCNAKGKPYPAPMFFGNMESDAKKKGARKKKKFSINKGDLELVLFSRKDDLAIFILTHLYQFFMQTNFGTRQSKGYGSFSLNDESWKKNMELVMGQKNISIPELKSPYFISDKSDKSYKLFQDMELFSKAIRSGINDCFGEKFYMKSLMFAYAKSKKEQWEKKTIKSIFYDLLSDDYGSDDINEQEKKRHYGDVDILTYTSKNEGAYLFKDCLGLSTVEKWKCPRINDDGKLSYEDYFTLTKSFRKTEIQPNTVQRMKSPILLKPVQQSDGKYKVYIMYNDIPLDFLKTAFNLKVDLLENEGSLPLKVYSDFSLKDYFDFMFKKSSGSTSYSINIYDMISKKGRETDKGKRIIKIFDEIRKTYNNPY